MKRSDEAKTSKSITTFVKIDNNQDENYLKINKRAGPNKIV